MTKHYTMEDGLPSNFVYRAVQDSKGFIWFCTDKGLVKFDGVKFENINLDDRLPHNEIFDIHLDKNEKLWLSTFNAICYIKNDSIHFLDMPNKQEAGLVKHRIIDSQYHSIQFRGTRFRNFYEESDRIYEIKNLERTHLSFIKGIHSYVIFDHKIPERTLNYFKNGKKIYSRPNTIAQSLFNFGELNFDDRNILFLQDSLLILKPNQYDIFSYTDLWGYNPRINQVRSHKGIFIINGEKGNLAVNSNFDRIDSLHYLTEKSFNSFIIDIEGNVWLCGNTGITYINQNQLTSRQYAIKDSEDSFTSLVATKERVLIATKSGKVFSLNDNKQLYKFLDLKLDNVKSIDAKDQTLYVHDFKLGLFKTKISDLDYMNIQLEKIAHSRSSSIKDYDIDKEDKIAVAYSRGAKIYNQSDTLKIYSQRAYSILMDLDTTFIGTTQGLYKSVDHQFEKIDSLNFNLYVHKLFKDNKSTLWILTNKGGLWQLNGDRIELIDGTKDLFINNITADSEDQLWLATTSGLYKFEIGNNKTKKLLKYGNSYGIVENNIVDLAYLNDEIYVITERKLYRLPIAKQKKKKNSKFYFNHGFVNNTKRHIENVSNLKSSENNIEINYTTISYTDLGSFNYKWKLLPTSTEWQETKENSLLFNSLSAGEYELIVSAFDSEGNVLHENERLFFKINKPWYSSNLFIVLALCSLSLMYFFIDKQRQLIQKNKADEKNEIQRQFYELRLKAVQAQMNPHFIFNALNSIQKFIYQKSPEEANYYIVKFSKLMRMILESTNKNYLTLQEEINLINNYISLEQLRFDHSFDYFLEIDEDLDPYSLLIPSTLLQPFVENAINHGLATKREKGHLWIRLYKKNSNLIAEIEDDGIGRDQAEHLKKRNHKSRALEIIEERKKILLQRDNYDLEFKYEDLLNTQHESIGTKLILSIPLLYEE